MSPAPKIRKCIARDCTAQGIPQHGFTFFLCDRCALKMAQLIDGTDRFEDLFRELRFTPDPTVGGIQ